MWGWGWDSPSSFCWSFASSSPPAWPKGRRNLLVPGEGAGGRVGCPRRSREERQGRYQAVPLGQNHQGGRERSNSPSPPQRWLRPPRLEPPQRLFHPPHPSPPHKSRGLTRLNSTASEDSNWPEGKRNARATGIYHVNGRGSTAQQGETRCGAGGDNDTTPHEPIPTLTGPSHPPPPAFLFFLFQTLTDTAPTSPTRRWRRHPPRR